MDRTGPPDAAHRAAYQLQKVYRWTQQMVADLTEAQLRWQPNPTTPAIRFHLFHIARWADVLQRLVTGADQELWQAEAVAAQWGLDPTRLGLGESGALVDEETAQLLPLPDRAELLAYCTRVLRIADQALAPMDETEMRRLVTDDEETFPVGEAIMDQLSHSARHLGMIECLRGVQGLRGTATV